MRLPFLHTLRQRWRPLAINGTRPSTGNSVRRNNPHEQSQSLHSCHGGARLRVLRQSSVALAQKKYDTGASDTEIKIGQTVPFSGAYSVYANIGKTQAAYFKMINDQGGINGRKINLIQYDDAYSPPKTVEQVRKLVEGDEVLFTFQIIGTPRTPPCKNISTARRSRSCWPRPAPRASTIRRTIPGPSPYNPNYVSEGRIYAKYILKEHPNAKIGVLYQNDDMGRDYLAGLKSGLGDKAASMIVGEVSYEVTDPTVDSQVVKLKSFGRRSFLRCLDTEVRGAGDQEGRRARLDAGAHPRHQCESDLGDAEAGRPRHLQGHHLDPIRQGPGDPQWKDDPGVKAFFAFMDKYFPEGDKLNTVNTYGYSVRRVADAGAETVRRRPVA